MLAGLRFGFFSGNEKECCDDPSDHEGCHQIDGAGPELGRGSEILLFEIKILFLRISEDLRHLPLFLLVGILRIGVGNNFGAWIKAVQTLPIKRR